MMATNLESAFHLTQLAYPLLKASGGGSVIFNSSLASLFGIENLSLYCATKGSVFLVLTPNLKLFNGISNWFGS
jgi:tropinone reductase I